MNKYLIITTVLLGMLLCMTASLSFADHHDPARIMLNNAKQAIDSGKVRLILDMRTKAGLKADSRTIPDSILITGNADLKKAIQGVSKEDLIITYCTWPNEESSAGLARALIRKGYKNTFPLEGGLKVWIEAGYPTQIYGK